MLTRLFATALLLSAAGCAKDEFQRVEGMTSGAGNAIAANTVMQMVDPWPVGVDKTNLKVPADRTAYENGAVAAAADTGSGAATSDTSKND